MQSKQLFTEENVFSYTASMGWLLTQRIVYNIIMCIATLMAIVLAGFQNIDPGCIFLSIVIGNMLLTIGSLTSLVMLGERTFAFFAFLSVVFIVGITLLTSV
jgi:hypothetical protein